TARYCAVDASSPEKPTSSSPVVNKCAGRGVAPRHETNCTNQIRAARLVAAELRGAGWHAECILHAQMIRSNRHAQSTDIEWITVSARRVCPICGGSLTCQIQSGGAFAACSKNPSDWPMTSGAWLHRVALPPPSILTREPRDSHIC